VIDLIVAITGARLLAVAEVDSVVSWPSNRVLIGDRQLARLAGNWLGWPASRWPVPWPLPARIGMAAAAALCIAVIAAGEAVGGAKGGPGSASRPSSVQAAQRA
jgi:hypothetical protein